MIAPITMRNGSNNSNVTAAASRSQQFQNREATDNISMVRHALVVLALAVAVRLWLIYLYPAIFGGDTVLRLANSDRIQLAYQLPGLQAAIYAVSNPLAVRYLMALIGAVASVGCYCLASHLMPQRAALLTGLIFASNPFLIQLSIVPYQEVLMLGALMFAFHFFFNGRFLTSSLALGLACLTRYEAWAACPVLAAAFLRQQGLRPAAVFKATLLFGSVPAAWILYHTGVSAPGTFVIELPRSVYRLMRYVYLGWITVKNTPIPVLVLALAGAWAGWKAGLLKDHRIQVLCAFLALVTLAILFSAHGESPDPERFVTSREASLWITAVTFAAGVALIRHSRLCLVLAIAGVALGIVDAHRFIRRDTSNPKIRLAQELARYLDNHMRPSETAVILTRPIPAELVEQYLGKVKLKSGDAGIKKAREILATIETTPPDYQRTIVHSRIGKRRLKSLAGNVGADPQTITLPPCLNWAAVWSDFAASNEIEASFYSSTLAKAQPVYRLIFGTVAAAIYRLNETCIPTSPGKPC